MYVGCGMCYGCGPPSLPVSCLLDAAGWPRAPAMPCDMTTIVNVWTAVLFIIGEKKSLPKFGTLAAVNVSVKKAFSGRTGLRTG